ncbi:hypothetical protein AWN76_015435 [Rhodothermaceae bacterium RA]|nr:hypothetical protein AWN76_015435 [Rhodothermaceae bacterium RA]
MAGTCERALPPAIQLVRATASVQDMKSDQGDHIVGRAPEMFHFRAVEGRLLEYEPLPGAEPSFMQTILSGELMAVLLRQRGLLVLHASCVAREDGAIVFVGDSGWGKSTTALHLVRHHGYTLMADDIAAIDCETAPPHVLPGPTQMKLGEDVGARYVEEFEELTAAHAFTRKRLYIHEQQPIRKAVPVRCVVLLEPEARAANRIIPLEARVALPALIEHTRGRRLLRSARYQAAHFQQVARLLGQVPVFLLERTRRLADLEDVTRHVLQAADRLASPL